MAASDYTCTTIFEVHNGEYTISTDGKRLDTKIIYKFLHQAWWAKHRPKTVQLHAIKHSLCFGVYHNKQQIGFARVVTDCAVYAYIMDVFILPAYQGQGLGKWLTETILQTPSLKTVVKWSLATSDAHGLYKKVGFSSPKHPEQVMELMKTK
jgi:GNAT superfamily N-acetyltransferase